MENFKNISKFGKGALKEKIDLRDYRLENLAMAGEFPKEYSIKDKIIKIKNQNGSSSCVGMATAYYAEVLNIIETGNKIQLSARDVYSLIYQKGGGAYIRDAMKKIYDSGIIPEEMAPSYENGKPPSESWMRKRNDITDQEKEEGMKYWAKGFFTWDKKNIEMYKRAIFEGNGCVVAVNGNDYLWNKSIIQIPDTKNQFEWLHCVLLTGWKYINNKLYFEICNSWGELEGDHGFYYLPTEYASNGWISSAYTLVDRNNDEYNSIQQTIFKIKNIIKNISDWITLMKVFNKKSWYN